MKSKNISGDKAKSKPALFAGFYWRESNSIFILDQTL